MTGRLLLRARWRDHWPLLAATALYLVLLGSAIAGFFSRTGAPLLIYAVDDAYIHMAIAKNLSQQGVFGVNPPIPNSSSTSPLWTGMLGLLFELVGVRDEIPLVLNVVFAISLLALCHSILRNHLHERSAQFLALSAIILFTPLTLITAVGMEHVLHTFLTVFVAHRIACHISAWPKPSLTPTLTAIPLLGLVRPEGLILAALASLLLLNARHIRLALATALLALIPNAFLTWAWVSVGELPLPNSVMLKGPPILYAPASDLAVGLYDRLAEVYESPHLLMMTIGALLVYVLLGLRPGRPRVASTMLVIAGTASLLDAIATGSEWFYRYDAYLVAFWILTMAVCIPGLLSVLGLGTQPVEHPGISLRERSGPDPGAGKRPTTERPSPLRALLRFYLENPAQFSAMLYLILILGGPLGVRAAAGLLRTSRAMTSIYSQQYQMASFLKNYYPGETVAINDLGMISYLSGVTVLDLVGIGETSIARARLTGQYGTDYIAEVTRTRGASIALVYDLWFADESSLPTSWIKVGEWSLEDPVALGADTVSFYALQSSETERLRQSLRAFSEQLPQRVIQRGLYLESDPGS